MDYKKLQESIDEKFIAVALDKGVSITDLYTRFNYRKHNLIQVYRNPALHYSKILVSAYLGVMHDYGIGHQEKRELKFPV